MDYKGLGERIRKQRLKLKLTQEKLAEKVEISESFMGHIERGDRKLSLETLVKLAQELNVSIDYLLLDIVKLEPDAYLNEIVSTLGKKDKKQVKALLNVVKLLAENLDKWVD